MTKFGRLDPDGTYTEMRDIAQESMKKCPHFIMVPEHYRADETCRCDDPDHYEMLAWGYAWDVATEKWVAPLDEDDE